MREWACLKPGCQFRKIMVYSCTEGTHVFLYDTADAVFCSADEFYQEEKDALDQWEDWIDTQGWQLIEDPLPGCQHDSILPIRVKGRDAGAPQWGQYEILKDGEWLDFRGD